MKRWYALRAKARRELAAASLLTRANLETYVPRLAAQCDHRAVPSPGSFFPGYLFGRLDRDLGEVRLARYTPGILQVVGYDDEPWPIPDDVVQSIQERLARGSARPAAPDFRSGERAIVAGGPLADFEAVYDRRLSGPGRARVLVRILGRLCHAEVRAGHLRRRGVAERVA